MFSRNALLQQLNLFIDELYDFAITKINQMIMMVFSCFFVTRPAILKVMAFNNARFLKQSHCAVNSGNRNIGIDRSGAPMDLLNIRVVVRD